MSNPPGQPPPQQQRPPPSQQQQQRPQQQQKAREQTKARDAGEQIAKPRQQEQTETQRQSTIEVQEETRVEGKGGAKNLATQWVDVWLPDGKPMYIIVTTLPEHDLQVSIEQRSWKKSYAAKGRVQTDVVPIAPIGTTGKLVAKDATTGEELTVNFHWYAMGGTSLFALIVKLVKRLFTNQKS
jgi:hypothetical protein